MRYITSLIFFIVIGHGAAWAQEPRYRVEILVLQQLEYDALPLVTPKLDDFSDAVDFLTPPDDDKNPPEREETAPEQPLEVAAEPEPSAQAEALIEPDPDEVLDAVVHVPEMGPQMQDAWRRLRLSGPLRPLQYLAWEQGPREPFPVLRVHDLEVLWTEDPWAEERALQELEEADDAADEPDQASGTDVADPEPEKEIPPPLLYYRLDGTASLTRSRFLHLRLALEWRTPVYDDPDVLAGPGDEAVPTAWQLYRLEQSRPVRTGRMEYFDGPVLGVLAWISEVVPPPESEASAEILSE